jgi:hypothetical protein
MDQPLMMLTSDAVLLDALALQPKLRHGVCFFSNSWAKS